MDDDDYNQLGVMEDSSSRISSGLWSTEEADRGLMGQGSGGGDSSLLVEAGLSDSQMDGDSNSNVTADQYLQAAMAESTSGKDFEWSAARETVESHNGVAYHDDDEELNAEQGRGRKRPFSLDDHLEDTADNDETADDDSLETSDKRLKTNGKETHPNGTLAEASEEKPLLAEVADLLQHQEESTETSAVGLNEATVAESSETLAETLTKTLTETPIEALVETLTETLAEEKPVETPTKTATEKAPTTTNAGDMLDKDDALWTAVDPIRPKIMRSDQLPDLEKYWRPVMESPKDFQAWTSLLQYVDHENDVAAAREAYSMFLQRYPYCYGYWKKWADYEKKKATKTDCEKVFERGLAAVPLSVDLWLHYLNYCRVHHAAHESFVREQFERAIGVCGLEFRSDRLWEVYINWEVERDDLRRVFDIYDKLLSIPTQFHTTHWENLNDLVNQNDPKELLTPDEYQQLKTEIFLERKISMEVIADIKLTEEEVQAIRNKTKERRQMVHSQTEKEIADRWAFEEGIKRPYFHVKPLERGQLKNWRLYLEFERGRGHQTRIGLLFERCLIACALYEEYWLSYAQHLETRLADDTEKEHQPLIESLLRSVYQRACTIHVCDKPTLYLMWATFEEKTGDLNKASQVLDLLEKAAPKLDSLAVRRVNLARRQGNHERVVALYRQYIEAARKDNATLAPLSLRASRFAAKVLDDTQLAEEFIEKALEKDPRNWRLYTQLFDVRFQHRPLDVASAVQVFNRALKSKMDLEQRCRFAHRKVEFLEDFGSSVVEMADAQEEYQQLTKRLQDDRQAKAAAQMAQQQASATNATSTESASEETSKPAKSEPTTTTSTPTAPTTTYAAPYDPAAYGAFQGQQAGYQAGYGYAGWTGYGTAAAGQYAGWGQGYYPQQYGQQ